MIYLIRHGQTVWNLQKRKQGHKDSPLTLKGVEQIKYAANNLKKLQLNYNNLDLRSSPLFRAQQSTSILSDMLNIDFNLFKFDDNFKEHSFGEWEGLTEEEINAEQLKERQKDKWNFVIPGGESYQLLFERVSKGLKSLNSKTILVTHDMICRVIKGIHLQLPPSEIMKIRNNQGSIYVLHDSGIDVI